MTMTRLALAALLLAAAPLSTASAFDGYGRSPFFAPHDPAVTGSVGVHDTPFYERCFSSSASEGNANQQTRPVKQYGQTSGGYSC